MKCKSILLLFSMISILYAQSQTTQIIGSVNDTLNKKNLSNATVSLIRAKDSILIKFTRTNTDGSFKLLNIEKEKYILLISNPTYADYIDNITIDDKPFNLGAIPLITKAKLLEEVVVKQKIAAIRMKGDTT